MDELNILLSKLNGNDYRIIKQLVSILHRYLEKRGRL
nr:MAG TPA: hypothetical protein [Caudoviricetes sp.]